MSKSYITGPVYQSGQDGSTRGSFTVPGLPKNEKYWLKVSERTGEIEVWNANALGDARVGVYDENNKSWTFNEGGLLQRASTAKEREIFSQSAATNLVVQNAQLVVQEDLIKNGTDAATAVSTSEKLIGTNSETQIAANLESQGMLKEALDGNISSRKGTNNAFPTLKYPQTLQADKQDCIRFSVMEYTPSKFKQGGRTGALGGFEEVGRGGGGLGGGFKDRKSIGSVTFPIPGGIREDNTVDWGDSTMNPIEAAMGKVALDFLTSNDAVGTVGDVGKAVKERQKEIGGGLALAIAQAAVGGSGRLLTRQTGAVLNPNMQLLFKQPQLRPFTFTFQLTPREKEEADTVMQIIRLFKQAMAPIRSDSMLFLKSPHTFKLTYLHQTKDHPYIGSIKECALMSCGVDYTPDENYSTYEDGVMTSYTLALQFKELEPVYNDDYGTSNAKNLNFSGAIREGQSRIEGTTDYAVDSGVAPGYGVNDDEGISPITGKKIDTSQGGSYI